MKELQVGDLITLNTNVNTVYLHPRSPDEDQQLTTTTDTITRTLKKNQVGVITQICPFKHAYAHIITPQTSGWAALSLLIPT